MTGKNGGIILLTITSLLLFINCNQLSDNKDKDSKTNSNQMLSRLLTQNKDKNERDLDGLKKRPYEDIYFSNNKMREYRLKLANLVLLENTSKTISLAEESIACSVSGSLKITTSVDLTILTLTDTYNKTAELSNEKRTITFDNCSNNEQTIHKSGTITHSQTTKSKLTIATSSGVLTETSTDGIETIIGSVVILSNSKNGMKERTVSFSNTLNSTKIINTYTVDSANTKLTSITPISISGSITGQITHSTPNGEKINQVFEIINKTY